MQPLDIPFLRFEEARQRPQDLNGGELRNGADVSFGLIGKRTRFAIVPA